MLQAVLASSVSALKCCQKLLPKVNTGTYTSPWLLQIDFVTCRMVVMNLLHLIVIEM